MKKVLVLVTAVLFTSTFLVELTEAKSRGGSSGGFKSSGSSSSRSSSSSSYSSSRSSSSYSSPSRSYSGSSSSSRSYSSPSGNYYGTPSRQNYSQPGTGSSYQSSPSYGSNYQSSPSYGGPGVGVVPMYGAPMVATGTSSSGGGGFLFLIIILVIVGIVVFVIIKNKKKKGSGEIEGETNEAHLFFVQAGFYFGKGELENQLIQTAKAVDTGDIGGLLTLLRETAMLIRKNNEGIRWYNFKHSKHPNTGSVEAAFEKLVSDERMKVENEEFTDQNGMEVDRKTKTDNLEEIIVINLAVACYSNILLDDGITFDNFQKIVSFFSAIPESSLLGANVVWNISDKDEMDIEYPELRGV